MWIPSSLNDEAFKKPLHTKNCFGLIVWLPFWEIMDWNLSGLTIILLSENHLMTFPDSAFDISNGNLTDLANDDGVLSSVKLWADAFLMQMKNAH